jgi:hypothetical protein
MNKAISPGSEFSEVGIDISIEPQYFAETAVGPEPNSPASAIQTKSAPLSGSADAKPQPAYPAPAELPTQQGPPGLKFDLNDGTPKVRSKGEQARSYYVF